MTPTKISSTEQVFQTPGQSYFSVAIRRYAHHFFSTLSYLDFYVAKFFSSAPDYSKINKNFQGQSILIYSVYINDSNEFLRLKNEILNLQTEFDLMVIVNTGVISILEITNEADKILAFDRKNTQRDFGSYKFGLKYLNLEGCRRICLINDSVFWQKDSVLDFLKKAELKDARVIGMTKSSQRGIHLQTYCLVFKEPVMEDFRVILELPPVLFKRSIVFFGELRLTRELMKSQTSFDSIWDADLLLESFQPKNEVERKYHDHLHEYRRVGIPLNPSIHLAVPLYRVAGMIKKVILKENPAKFSNSIITILNDHVQSILLDFPMKDLRKD